MQLPPQDELVMVSGCHPIRAKKARYYEDAELKARILPPPNLHIQPPRASPGAAEIPSDGDWSSSIVLSRSGSATEDPANAGIRREPELPAHEDIAPKSRHPIDEFEPIEDEPDDAAVQNRLIQRSLPSIARQVSLDPTDDMGM